MSGKKNIPVLVPDGSIVLESGKIFFHGDEICDPVLKVALRLIHDKALLGLTVEEITQATEAPRRMLERKFRKQLKTSPHYEILHRQVCAARKLLEETPLKLREISELAGFRSVSHLCVAIKRAYKKTPIELRREKQQNYEPYFL